MTANLDHDALGHAVTQRREELSLSIRDASGRSRRIDVEVNGSPKQLDGLGDSTWTQIGQGAEANRYAHTLHLIDQTLRWPEGTAHALLHGEDLPEGEPADGQPCLCSPRFRPAKARPALRLRKGLDLRDYQRLAYTTLELPDDDSLAEANRESFAAEMLAAANRLREVAERFERLAYPDADIDDPRIPDYVGATDRAIDALVQSHVLAASRIVKRAVDARDTHRAWLEEVVDAQG